jgi:hypothetical protein
MASAELDLDLDELTRFPTRPKMRYRSMKVVPAPYQVQVERNPHRQALAHYDFVYVFTVDRDAPVLRVKTNVSHKSEPTWYSLQDVESRRGSEAWSPHEGMVETMRRIVADLKAAGHGSNKEI